MNAIPSLLESAQTRTLANVLLNLAEQKRLGDECIMRWDRAYEAGDRDEEDRQGDIGSAIDLRISDLEAEAKGMILAATGVSWDQLCEALA
jgi:hypothetical protein